MSNTQTHSFNRFNCKRLDPKALRLTSHWLRFLLTLGLLHLVQIHAAPAPQITLPTHPASAENPNGKPSRNPPWNFGDFPSFYRSMRWKVEQGLPQNHVTAIYQSRDGYIWVGTVFGLARYDAARFTVFERSTVPAMELADDHVLDVNEDAEGTLWVCLKNGLLARHLNTWTSWLSIDTNVLDGLQPTSVVPAERGGVWVGSQGAILHFNRSGLIKRYNTPHFKDARSEVRSIRKIIEMPDGTLYCADRYRLMRFNPGTGVFESLVLFETIDQGWLRYLYKDNKQRILFGGFTIWQWKDNQAVRFGGVDRKKSPSKGHDEITQLRQDRDGMYWATTLGGLRQYQDVDGELFQTGEIPFTQDEEPVELWIDRENNLWVGSMYEGLSFFQERQLRSLLSSKHPGAWKVWCVAEGKPGELWVGTSKGLFRHQNGEITSIPMPEQRFEKGSAYLVHTIHTGSDGKIWAGISHSPFGYWDGSSWTLGTNIPALRQLKTQPFESRAIIQDRLGRFWASHDSGVLCFDQTNLIYHFVTGTNFPCKIPYAIREDAQGRIWAGGRTGLCRFDPTTGKWTEFFRKPGVRMMDVNVLHIDKNGALWIGSSVGLTRFREDPENMVTLTRHEGLYDNLINYLVEDDSGRFWLSCNRGIYYVQRSDLESVADGGKTQVSYTAFGEADGMLSSETNVNGQNAGAKIQDGSIFFPTTKGLVHIDTSKITINTQKPTPLVEEVIANGKRVFGETFLPPGITDTNASRELYRPRALPSSRSIQVPHLEFSPGKARVLEIHYTASSFVDPSKVRFRYMLQGHDTDWQNAETRRVTHYTNLDPGEYSFIIAACNNHGFWSESVPGLVFSVAPFFYQTWTFKLGCTAIVLVLVGAIQSYRLGVQRQILQLEKDSALQTERTRIAKDMHDELGARLTQLGLISEMVEQPGFDPHRSGRSSLPKISTLARDAVRSLDEIVWAVTPDKNRLNELAGYLSQAAQDMVAPKGLSLELQIPNDLPAVSVSGEVRHNLFLIAKEALNNAVKHAQASRITLKLTHESGAANLFIVDDGRGFEMATAEGQGNGLENMRRRAEMIHGKLKLASSPQGTSITIRFPIGPHTHLPEDLHEHLDPQPS